jgi:hypothetical protein
MFDEDSRSDRRRICCSKSEAECAENAGDMIAPLNDVNGARKGADSRTTC